MGITNTHKRKPRLHRAYQGSTLIVTLCVLTLLIGFMGIGIYMGVQSYLQSELQKAVNASVLVGASEMYTSTGNSLPTINTGAGSTATVQTLQSIVGNSPALQSFGTSITNGPVVDAAEHSVQMELQGNIPTPFLSLMGINQINVTAEAKAQALRLVPTSLPGQNVYIRPSGWPALNPATGYQQLASNFPIVDRQGNDIYIQQGTMKKGYMIEACTSTDCYAIGPGAVSVDGTPPWPDPANKNIVYGDVLIDLAKVGVKKANSFKISDDGLYYSMINGTKYITTGNNDLTLSGISIFGYAGLCPPDQACQSVPLGYARY